MCLYFLGKICEVIIFHSSGMIYLAMKNEMPPTLHNYLNKTQGAAKELRHRPNMLLKSVHKRKDGTSFPVEINIRVFMLDDKEYMVAAARDITERNAVEEELEKPRKNLEQLVDERTEKLAGKTQELEKSQKALQFLLEDVNEAKKKLETNLAQIERMNRIFVDRELRMVELKQQIRELEEKLNVQDDRS